MTFSSFKTGFFSEITGPMLAVSIYASLGGLSFGIDYNYWSGVLGLTEFHKTFGVYDETEGEYVIPSTWQSAGSGLPIAGLAFGALIAGLIGGKLGRVRTFQVSAAISLVAIIIQATAISSYWQIVVGRMLNSVALGVLANLVPAYQAECAPSAIRGTLVNCYQFSLGVGAVLVNTTNWGMHARTDQWAYRAVIILQFIVPLVLGAGSFFIPESPRWLARQGREAEMREKLVLLRRGDADAIDKECETLMAAVEENRRNNEARWVDCFIGSNLRRTLIVTGVQCLQQAQGASFMSSYAVVFLQSLGIKNTYEISVLLVFTMTGSCFFAFYFPDKIGRRPIMIVSAGVMAVAMFIVAGMTGYGLASKESAMNAALGMLFVWWFFVSLGWSSCVWIVTAEVPTLYLREKTITVGTFLGFCASVIVTFVSPYIQDKGYGNLQGRIGFVYGSVSIVTFFWAMFMLPETKGRSLEELDVLFAKGVSVWRFGSYKSTAISEGIEPAEAEKVIENFDKKE